MTSHTNPKHNNNHIIQLALASHSHSLSHNCLSLLRRLTLAPQSSNQMFQLNVMQNRHPLLIVNWFRQPTLYLTPHLQPHNMKMKKGK